MCFFYRVNHLAEEIALLKDDGSSSIKDFVHPEHNGIRGVSGSIELRLVKLEQNMEKILELLIQQSQKHGSKKNILFLKNLFFALFFKIVTL